MIHKMIWFIDTPLDQQTLNLECEQPILNVIFINNNITYETRDELKNEFA